MKSLWCIDAEQYRWWEEALRRCHEAEKHPEHLIDPDTFFETVLQEIEQIKRLCENG